MKKYLIERYLLTSVERLNLVSRHLRNKENQIIESNEKVNNRIEKEFQLDHLNSSDIDSIFCYLDVIETEIKKIREIIKTDYKDSFKF